MRCCCCQRPFVQAGVLASPPRCLLQSRQATSPRRKTWSVVPSCPFARRGGKRGRLPAPAGVAGHRLREWWQPAAGTPGYDRSAEYVADRLKEAGYLVHFEEFEFPFFEERVPPVLLVSFPDGRQEPAPADAFRTLTNSGSSNVTARLHAVNSRTRRGTATRFCQQLQNHRLR